MLNLKIKIDNTWQNIFYCLGGFLLYLTIVIAIQYHYVVDLWNPSWGDMVSIPLSPIPFKNIFLLWFDQFSGSFGMVNIPQFILSQFTPVLSPHILQLLYINFNFIVLYFGVFAVLGRFDIKEARLKMYAALLLSLIYLFSNVNINNYAQGQFETSIVYTFGMLMAFYLYFLFRDKKLSDLLILFFLLLASTWYNWLSIFYIGLFLLPEFIVLSVWGFSQRRIKIKEYLIALVIFMVLFLFANLNIVYQLYFNLFSAVSFTTAALSSSDGIKSEINYMYANSTMLNSLYNAGNKGDVSNIYFDYQSRFLDINYSIYTIFTALNVLVMIFLFSSYYGRKTRKLDDIDILIYTFFIYFIGLTFISYLFYLQKGSFLIDNLPFVSIYRNPKKFMLSEFMCGFIVYLFFLVKIPDKKKYILLLLGLVILNFAAKFQFLSTGYLGKDLQYNANKVIPADSYHNIFVNESSYPQYYKNLKEFFFQQKLLSTERIVVVPNNSQTLYESFLRYDFPLFHVPANANILSGGDINSSIISALYNDIVNTRDLSNILKIGNVKYIVVDRKGPYYLWNYTESVKVREFGSIWLWGRPESVNRRLGLQPNLKKVLETEDFYIYEFVKHNDEIFYIPGNIAPNTELLNKEIAADKNDLYLSAKDFEIQIKNNISEINNINKLSSTEYSFDLKVNEAGKFPIFFSQKFSPNWRMQILNENRENVNPDQHTIGNGFGNVWFVNIPKPGVYKVKVDFTIQKTNQIFTWIAFSTIFLTVLGMIGIKLNLVKQKK